MKCTECGRIWPKDRFNEHCSSPTVCFKCRSRSFGIFIPHREHFHNTTDREAQRLQVAEAKANGAEAIPAWHKTFTAGGLPGQEARLKKALESTDAKQ